MATLYTQQESNTRRTWLLMAIFLVLVIVLGWLVSFYYQSPVILYVAIIFSLAMNFAGYWWSDKIVLKLAGARPAKRDEYLELNRLVENLSITAGLPMPKVYIIADQAPNAFATGRDKNHAVVAVTEGLLNLLDKNELEGVVAHELAHIGNRDILLQSIVVVLVGLIAILSDMFIRSRFIFGNSRDNKAGGIIALIGLVFIILSPIIASLIQLAISRQREFLADSSGALLTRYPEGLASALEKIGSYSQPLKKASNAMAHLYISNPFGAQGSKKGLTRLFMTHPPIQERVAKLRHLSS